MDFLNKAKEQFSQNSANQGQQGGMDPNQQGQNTGAFGGGNNPNQQQGMNAGAFGGGNNNNIAGGANNSGQEDYGDKGMLTFPSLLLNLHTEKRRKFSHVLEINGTS
jgi:hypothetical protein